MTPFEELADEVRSLRKELAGQRRRMNQMMVIGTVKSVTGSKVKVSLADDGEDGEITTPDIRMANNTGKRGSGVSKFTKMGVGESVLVISPNGEVGTGSVVIPWADTGDDPSPGAAENDGDVVEVGNAKCEVRDGYAALTVGTISLVLQGDSVSINGKLQVNGTSLKHNSKSVGDTHTHKDVLPGPANTGVPT